MLHARLPGGIIDRGQHWDGMFSNARGQRDKHKTTTIPGNAWRYFWTLLLVSVHLSNFARLTRVERRAVKM